MAWLGALAFALQILLPLVHPPALAAVPIATHQHGQAAHQHEVPAPPSAPAEHAGGHECPLCNIVKSCGALPPSGVILLRLPVATGPVRPIVTVDTTQELDRYRKVRPRAPPLSH